MSGLGNLVIKLFENVDLKISRGRFGLHDVFNKCLPRWSLLSPVFFFIS